MVALLWNLKLYFQKKTYDIFIFENKDLDYKVGSPSSSPLL